MDICDISKIENIMLHKKNVFCEFLTCLHNSGLCDITVDFKNDSNFCFCRSSKDFGINDLFIYFDDEAYFFNILSRYADVNCITVIPKINYDLSFFIKTWKVTQRRQFTKDKSDGLKIYNDLTELTTSHLKYIEKSTSETVKNNYAISMKFDDECYAIIKDDALYCFASVSKVETLKLAEVNWIYTEPEYRYKGCATQLLSQVADKLISKGYTVTYHCACTNVASATTALRCGFEEVTEEIVMEREC